MRTRRSSPPARTDEALGQNVKATLATAVQVLEHFQQSLRKSGFVEGAESYGRMADTLIGQKMWSASRALDTDAEFATIASLARSIHEMLAPYSHSMLRISGLGPAAAVPAPTAAPVDAADALRLRILNVLGATRRPVSLTALRTQCGCDRRALGAELAALEQAARVKRQEKSGRTLYSLGAGLDR